MVSRVREGIPPFSFAFIRLHPGFCIQLWDLQHKKHMDLFEQVQRRDMKKISELEDLCYEERLRELGLFSLEKRKLQGQCLANFQ